MKLSLSEIAAKQDRFWRFVAPMTDDRGCWEWFGGRNGDGYGTTSFGMSAHRVSFILHNGEIGSAWVLHRCDNPSCVNPVHLFLGDNTANVRDMVAKGRHSAQLKTHCKRGHLLSGDNLRPHPLWRVCRACKNDRRIENGTK